MSLREHWDLDPDVHFLNHGSFGACPRRVLEAQHRYRAELERQPVRFMARELEGRLDATRAALAPFLGCAAEDLVFVPNATTAVNAVLRSMELATGDELLVTDHAYNACRNALEFVAARAGARVVVATVPFPLPSAEAALEAVLARAGERTRLALLDHVTSPTGVVLPLETLVPALRERGIETLVDGAHAPGMLPLDLDALDAAYYTGNLHKWVCAPKGAAFLRVRRELQDSVRPVVISHGANSPRPGRSRYLVEFDWVGTDDPTAVLAVKDALEVVGGLVPGGWDEVRERNRALALAARRALCLALEVEPPTPDDRIGTLVTVPVAPGAGEARGAFDVDPLQGALLERYGVEVPVVTWPAPPRRWVRASAQLYNDLSQYELLGRALVELGARA